MSAYRKGAEFERWIVREFCKVGYAAVRVAGSRGPVDVVGYNGVDHLAIQAKVRRSDWLQVPVDDFERFEDYSRRLGAVPYFAWKPSHTTKPAHNGFRGNAIFLRPGCFGRTSRYYTISLDEAMRVGDSVDDVLRRGGVRRFLF